MAADSTRTIDEISGATRLRLFPIKVRISAGRFLVIRRGTGRMLQTSDVGVESILLLRKGLSVDRARADIGAKHGCDPVDVDIRPLIEALLDAGFVKEIDGRKVPGQQAGVGQVLRRAYAAYFFAPVVSSMIRWAPISVTARLMLRPRPSRDSAVVEQIALNMRRVPALARGDEDIQRLATENGTALRNFYVERLLLASLRPATLNDWMRRRVRVDGLEHLDREIAAKHGVILCAFHVTSHSMIPFVLASRGYAQTVLMDATDDSAREIRARIAEMQHAGVRYAIEPVAVSRGVRTVLRSLERGTNVLLLFDPTVEQSREHVRTPFLGVWLRVARGVAWLALRAQAPVLPVSIRNEGIGRYHLTIHRPLTELERSNEATILATLAQRLEREILVQPATWLKWKDFHLMVEHDPCSCVGGVA